MAHFNLANTFREQGRAPEAIAHYEMATRLRPDAPEVHANYAAALALAGQGAESLAQSAEAVRLPPRLRRRARQSGRRPGRGEAGCPRRSASSTEALRLKPDFPEAEEQSRAGPDFGRAAGRSDRPFRTRPPVEAGSARGGEQLWPTRASISPTTWSGPDGCRRALQQYEEALRISPRDREIRQSYAGALRLAGRPAEAEAQLDEVLRLGLER